MGPPGREHYHDTPRARHTQGLARGQLWLGTGLLQVAAESPAHWSSNSPAQMLQRDNDVPVVRHYRLIAAGALAASLALVVLFVVKSPLQEDPGEIYASISAAVKRFQSEVAELQWTMQNEQQLLLQSLSVKDIDSDNSLERAGQVLAMESQFKLAHLKLLITIKNELTDEQIQMIQQRLQQKRQGRAQ